MPTFISILRGINVSGRNLIKMEELRSAYQTLGFAGVTTFIQSGNVVFTAEKSDPTGLEKKIAHKIKQDFGFDVPVMVLSVEKMRRIIDKNPFLHNADKDAAFLHVTFLASKPAGFDRKKIEAKINGNEAVSFSDSAVYLYCPNGYGKTGLNNNFIESQLTVNTTTRNWKTTLELLRLAEQLTS